MNPVERKPEKNPAKPRFFERASPNKMWQSNILTFPVLCFLQELHSFSDQQAFDAFGFDIRWRYALDVAIVFG